MRGALSLIAEIVAAVYDCRSSSLSSGWLQKQVPLQQSQRGRWRSCQAWLSLLELTKCQELMPDPFDGVDPHEYLRDVLTRITETTSWQVAELTPGKWADMKLSLKKAA